MPAPCRHEVNDDAFTEVGTQTVVVASHDEIGLLAPQNAVRSQEPASPHCSFAMVPLAIGISARNSLRG